MNEEGLARMILDSFDNSGGCACGSAYVRGVYIQTHCHRCSAWIKENTDCSCKYAGIHIGFPEELPFDFVKEFSWEKLGSTLKKQLEEQWSAEFSVVFLGCGRVEWFPFHIKHKEK